MSGPQVWDGLVVSPGVARILKRLQERQSELVDLGVHKILTEIPAYRGIEDPALLADIRLHVDRHNTAILRSIEAGRPLSPEELAFVRPHVDRRIGRIPLSDFMQGFRCYHEVFWDAVLEAAEDDETRDAALAIVSIVLRYLNTAATHAAEVYAEAESLRHAHGERVRRDLLEDLLAGRAPEAGPRLTAAHDAGLRPDSECVVVVARSVNGPGEQDLRSATSALARAARTPVPPLAVVRQDEIVIVVPAELTDVRAFAAELVAVHQRISDNGTDLAVGVSAVQADLGGVPAAYRDAWEAMELTRPRGGVLALATLRAFDFLTLFGRQTAQRLVPQAVREFVQDDLAEGGVLIDDAVRVRRRRSQRARRGRPPVRARQHRALPAQAHRGAHRLRPAQHRRRARSPDRGEGRPAAGAAPSARVGGHLPGGALFALGGLRRLGAQDGRRHEQRHGHQAGAHQERQVVAAGERRRPRSRPGGRQDRCARWRAWRGRPARGRRRPACSC